MPVRATAERVRRRRSLALWNFALAALYLISAIAVVVMMAGTGVPGRLAASILALGVLFGLAPVAIGVLLLQSARRQERRRTP